MTKVSTEPAEMTKSSRVFLGSTALSLLVCGTGFADASPFDREMTAMYCAPYNSNDELGSYAIRNPSPSQWKYFACAVPNDAQRDLTQVQNDGSAIKVYAWAIANQSVRVWPCLSYYSTTGGTCGNEANNGSTTGGVVISPSVSTWRNATSTDMPYLAVYLAPCQNAFDVCSQWNEVRGYKVTYIDI